MRYCPAPTLVGRVNVWLKVLQMLYSVPRRTMDCVPVLSSRSTVTVVEHEKPVPETVSDPPIGTEVGLNVTDGYGLSSAAAGTAAGANAPSRRPRTTTLRARTPTRIDG